MFSQASINHKSGQIIATSAEVTPSGGLLRESLKMPLFQVWELICPDTWICFIDTLIHNFRWVRPESQRQYQVFVSQNEIPKDDGPKGKMRISGFNILASLNWYQFVRHFGKLINPKYTIFSSLVVAEHVGKKNLYVDHQGADKGCFFVRTITIHSANC